jgi:fused signal recognition particle receptor
MFSSGKQTAMAGQSPGMLARLRRGLSRTRAKLFSGIEDLFRQRRHIDPELLEEIEARLLQADLGVAATARIIEALSGALRRDEMQNFEQLVAALRERMVELLALVEQPLDITGGFKPFVLLVVGVNGSGKTTTIGKLARYYSDSGHRVVLAAGDTYRAAAIDQIKVWGDRTGTPVIAQGSGADPAAVIYDALQSARSQGADLVIADTAGRLHNKDNLMQELAKIRRTITKFDPSLPVEVLLVLDAGTGQNALAQARQFNEVIGVTGIALTKLDGTARGGVLFSIADALHIPIRFIGVGEQADDLRPFRARDFVDALLDPGT